MVLEVHYTVDYRRTILFCVILHFLRLPLFARNTELNLSVFQPPKYLLPPNGVVPVFLSLCLPTRPLL